MAPSTIKAGCPINRNTPGCAPHPKLPPQPGPEPPNLLKSLAWTFSTLSPAWPSTSGVPSQALVPQCPPPAWPRPPRAPCTLRPGVPLPAHPQPNSPSGGAHQLGTVHALHEILVLGLALAAGAGLAQAMPALHPLPLEGVTGRGLAVGLRHALPQQPPVHIDAQLPLQLPERHGSALAATLTPPGLTPPAAPHGPATAAVLHGPFTTPPAVKRNFSRDTRVALYGWAAPAEPARRRARAAFPAAAPPGGVEERPPAAPQRPLPAAGAASGALPVSSQYSQCPRPSAPVSLNLPPVSHCSKRTPL